MFAEITRRLADWHSRQLRDLPWRDAPAGRRDPYRVWVSEIMLQQTRVETIVDYYPRWISRFPTLATLAAADLHDVLKLWEGLGYYARARNLHRAAKAIVNEHGGAVPVDRKALLALPGVGRYTAGAILSLAFGQPEPLLEGNVKRVLARLFDVAEPLDHPGVVNQMWAWAEVLVRAAPPGQAGSCNEALMELGATICTPQNPRCLLCPLADLCQAAAQGTQNERPVTPPRRRTPHYHVTAGVIWQGEALRSPLLIAQRPADGMLGGLWEFPGGKLEPTDPDLPACLRREIAEELGIGVAVGEPVTVVEHAYTHFRITLHAFHARLTDGEPQPLGCADWRWVGLEELDRFPFPVTDRKIIAALGS